MNAIDCFKNGGMPLIEMILDNAPSFAGCYSFGIDDYDSGDHSKTYEDCVSLKDLKKIVEAWELVGNFGGFEKANKTLKKAYDNCSSIISIRKTGFECSYSDLQEAINLVEQCQ